jgi:hypothetical protein
LDKRHARVRSLERLPDSPNGEPVWRIVVPWSTYGAIAVETVPGAYGSLGITPSWEGATVEMTVNPMGKIVGIARI